jgi:hypothetical protein
MAGSGPIDDRDDTVFHKVIRYFLKTPPSHHATDADEAARLSGKDGRPPGKPADQPD